MPARSWATPSADATNEPCDSNATAPDAVADAPKRIRAYMGVV